MARTPSRSSAGRLQHANHARLTKLKRTVGGDQRGLEVQLQRIAQLQADIDAIR
jgi:hypothetical protein